MSLFWYAEKKKKKKERGLNVLALFTSVLTNSMANVLELSTNSISSISTAIILSTFLRDSKIFLKTIINVVNSTIYMNN